MGIGGVSDYSNLFHNYKVPEIPAVDYRRLSKTEESATQADQSVQSVQSSRDIDLSIEESPVKRPGPTDVNEISLSFNRGEDYSYIGSDSDLAGLDMQKAISDMQKDKVLQQYQYFVGESRNLQGADEDGTVIVKF